MSIDWSKPVQTRDGRPVEIITRHGRGRWPVVGYMDKDNYPSTWTACGMYYPGEIRFACFDLINVPERTAEVVEVDQ